MKDFQKLLEIKVVCVRVCVSHFGDRHVNNSRFLYKTE